MKNPESWYKMKLGESMYPSNNESILRVPGGWVYGDLQGCCFIPFSKEFEPKDESIPF